MGCPNSLRVLGLDIPVVIAKPKKEGKESIDEYSFGEWDPTNLSIHINNLIPIEHQKIVLLHELLHGMDELLNLNLPHKVVYALSQSLYAFILENQEAIDWIYEK